MTAFKLFEPLRLPNGVVIPNRIATAAMEENLANEHHAPGEALIRLYRGWAESGAGLIITGNVMVDRHALTGPAGVVLEDDRNLRNFRVWADACRSRGAQAWMQINHPGRQRLASMGRQGGRPGRVVGRQLRKPGDAGADPRWQQPGSRGLFSGIRGEDRKNRRHAAN